MVRGKSAPTAATSSGSFRSAVSADAFSHGQTPALHCLFDGQKSIDTHVRTLASVVCMCDGLSLSKSTDADAGGLLHAAEAISRGSSGGQRRRRGRPSRPSFETGRGG
eukprot:2935540-Prymnesium_polylepis.1